MSEMALFAPQEEAALLRSSAGVRFPAMWNVPVTLDVRVPMPGVSLRGMKQLKAGDVLMSVAIASDEVALFAAGVALS